MIQGEAVAGIQAFSCFQVHHAVCDGFHVGMFVEKLQEYVDNFGEVIV